MIRSSQDTALNAGFAEGFLETTRAYLAHDSAPSVRGSSESIESGAAPLPVIERGTGPRPMLHVLGPDSD